MERVAGMLLYFTANSISLCPILYGVLKYSHNVRLLGFIYLLVCG